MKNPQEEKPKMIPKKEVDKIAKKALKQGFKKDPSLESNALAAGENVYGFSSEETKFSGSTMDLLEKLFPKMNTPLKFDMEIERLSSLYLSKAELLRQIKEKLDDIDSEINELKNSVREFEKPHQKAILLDKADDIVYKFSLQGAELEKKRLAHKDLVEKGEKGLENIAKKIKKILDRVQLQ